MNHIYSDPKFECSYMKSYIVPYELISIKKHFNQTYQSFFMYLEENYLLFQKFGKKLDKKQHIISIFINNKQFLKITSTAYKEITNLRFRA